MIKIKYRSIGFGFKRFRQKKHRIIIYRRLSIALGRQCIMVFSTVMLKRRAQLGGFLHFSDVRIITEQNDEKLAIKLV